MEFSSKIAIIGLGYVGLPLARLFATRHAEWVLILISLSGRIKIRY
jgi:UDP-N-acetyl-D-mannosaminuronate dehydrogenase